MTHKILHRNFPGKGTAFKCILGSEGRGGGDNSPIWGVKGTCSPKGYGVWVVYVWNRVCFSLWLGIGYFGYKEPNIISAATLANLKTLSNVYMEGPFLVSGGHILELCTNFIGLKTGYRFLAEIWNWIWKSTDFGRVSRFWPYTHTKTLGSTPPGEGI